MTSERTLRAPAPARVARALAAIVLAALALRLALVIALAHRPTHDTRIFVSWAHLLMQYGRHGFYAQRDPIDHFIVNYPPGYTLSLGAVTAIYRLLGAHGNDAILGSLLKVPAVLADLVLCAIVYAIARRFVDARRALVAPAIAAFAPFSWPISAMWGQVDSICATFMVAALAFALSRRYTLAWSALALAVLFKPLPIVVLPLLVVAQVRDRIGWSRAFVGPLAALAIAYLVALPFAPGPGVATVFHWLADEYLSGQSLTDATSVNAYNIWTLALRPMRDGTLLFGISAHAWGWIAVGLTIVATAVVLARMPRATTRALADRTTIVAWFVVLDAFFIFSTRMHERYVLFALALTPLLWFCGRVERAVALTTVATFVICVVLVLGVYEHGLATEIVPLTHALSFVNVIAFVAIAFAFVRRST